jgi:hypothetical protein
MADDKHLRTTVTTVLNEVALGAENIYDTGDLVPRGLFARRTVHGLQRLKSSASRSTERLAPC